MTPKIDNDTLLDNIEFEEQVSRTYYLDREKYNNKFLWWYWSNKASNILYFKYWKIWTFNI